MPISRKTSSDYAESMIEEGERLNDAIHDLRFGPLADSCIRPQSVVLEDINTDIREVDDKLTLADPTVFEGDNFTDLEGIAYNSGIDASLGSPSVGTFYAISQTGPSTTQSLVVPRGYPIPATGGEGDAITFLVDAEVRVTQAQVAAYYDASNNVYRIPVAATSIQRGSNANVSAGNVGPSFRSLPFVTTWELDDDTSGGTDASTAEDLIQLILLADQGEDARLGSGLEASVLSRFPQSRTIALAGPGSDLLTRADECALDVFVQGSSVLTRRDLVTFVGANQLLSLPSTPVTSIVSVRQLSTGTSYVQDTDFEFVADTSGLGGSTRAADAIRFLPTGTLPTSGDAITVEYQYNSLITDMQAEFESDELDDRSRSILFRAGTAKTAVLTYRARLYSGFNETTIFALINSTIVDYVNSLGMGAPVERSDINSVVRALSAVDNFVIDELYFDGDAAGLSDLELAANEYAVTSTITVSGTRF